MNLKWNSIDTSIIGLQNVFKCPSINLDDYHVGHYQYCSLWTTAYNIEIRAGGEKTIILC